MNKKNLILILTGSLLLNPININLLYSQDTKKEFVENARKYLGTDYRFGGRLTDKNPDIDCLGLLFLSYSKTFKTNWTEFSICSSKLIQNEELGAPVKGLDGILSENVDISKLEEGDIIYLLAPYNPSWDVPIVNINKDSLWVQHMGTYTNKEKNLFLEANPELGVIERNFNEVLKEYYAIFVTRFH